MLFNIRVFLWSIIAELEYHLYPWKDEKQPPVEVAQKYNLSDFEKNLNYDWIKSHDEKISRLQEEMYWVQKEIHKINLKMKSDD